MVIREGAYIAPGAIRVIIRGIWVPCINRRRGRQEMEIICAWFDELGVDFDVCATEITLLIIAVH